MKKRGFTLIELIAVIVVLGIILAIAIPSITGVIKSSSMKAFESDAKIVLKALDYKKMEVDNFDPTSVNKSTIENLLKISDNNYSSLTVVLEAGTPVISIIGFNKWEGFIACGTFHNMKVVENATDCSDDNVYPELIMLGTNPVSIFINQTYTDAGATASDNIDGNMTSKIIVTSNLNPSVPGSYTVTYTVTDSAGNVTTLNRTVNVIDNVAPIVTFGTNGNSTYAKTRSTTVTVSDVGGISTSSLKYLWNTSTTAPTEATFTTTLTNGSTISTPASVTGGYYLWILGKDTAGNTAITRSNVFNLDNTKPVITVTGSNPASMIAGSTYTDAGATATDVNSGVNGTVTSSSNVNPNAVGSYTVTYTATDNAGNTQTATRTVNVTDSIAPTIAFGTNGNSTYAKTRSTTVTVSDNATVNTSSLKYLWSTSATAPAEASITTSFTNGGTITTPAGVTGSYYLWILGKDTSGNTTITGSNVFNLDNTVPVIAITGTTPISIAAGSTYTDAGATATDAHSGINGTVAATSTVNPSVPGTYTVTYNVSDKAGNAATAVVRTVNVIISEFTYGYTGSVQTFTAPVTGNYKLEVWGAQGGGSGNNGGLGGYSTGTKSLTAGQTLYVYVGGQGGNSTASTNSVGGWNGGAGGSGYHSYFGYATGGGGGATDIRTFPTEVKKYYHSSTTSGASYYTGLSFNPGTYYIIVYGSVSDGYTLNIGSDFGTISGVTKVNSGMYTFTLTVATSVTNGTFTFSGVSASAPTILIQSSLDSRIIVAGGGGGSGYYTKRYIGDSSYIAYGYKKGGIGGGLTGGGSNTSFSGINVIDDGQGLSGIGGGTQTGTNGMWSGSNQGIPYFGGGLYTSVQGNINGGIGGAGGGGGYYGGSSGFYNSYQVQGYNDYHEETFNGAGGSSYIGGVTSGTTSGGVRSGNGYAKITYIP